jgi:adenylate kinase
MDSAELAQKIKVTKDWLAGGSINIFGRPYAGKDTQCRKLAKLLNASLIGGGDILRSNKSFAATQAKVEDGSLAPSDEFLQVVTPYFSEHALKDQPLVLSSLGRWHGEEESILEAAASSGHPVKAVIYIDIDDNEVKKRWQAAQQLGDRGIRADDAEVALDKRLDEFQNKTIPVIEFYKAKGLLIEIDGNNSPDNVTKRILEELLRWAVDLKA